MLPSLFFSSSLIRLLPLLLLMAATRMHHVGSALHLPDASWAVFFLGGFYLAGAGFWLLMAAAVALDFAAFAAGVSTYCLSPAYPLLLPAYAALWGGGRLLRRGDVKSWRFALRAAVCWLVAASAAYLLTNGGFYWFSGRVIAPSWTGYAQHAPLWYGRFISAPVPYLVVAALLHAGLAPLWRWRTAAR